MALITCPDCNRPISDLAPACIHCGRPRITEATSADRDERSTTNPRTESKGLSDALPLPYFEVGAAKFVAMSIVTWGLYDLYWAYQQWARIKERTHENLSPGLRAFFGHLWGFSLFKRIHADATSRGVSVEWASGLLGFLYLIMVAVWRLPDPWWLITVFAFIPIIPVVLTVSAIHDTLATHRDRNSRLSGGNVAGLIFGSLFLVLAVIGTFMPET